MILENQVSQKFKSLKLWGMQRSYEEMQSNQGYADMSFDDKISLLLDRETLERENKALKIRLTKAKFKKIGASLDTINPCQSRGFDRTALLQVSQSNWILKGCNILITGPSGAGKSHLATAIAHKACLNGYQVRYFRFTQILNEMEIAKDTGVFHKELTKLGKIPVLVIDDAFLSTITELEQKHLFEFIEERHGKYPTILTSQNPIDVWHKLMPNSAIADAILDRLVHGSQRFELKGESLRKAPVTKTSPEQTAKVIDCTMSLSKRSSP